MVCAPIRSIIPSLKLGDYLSVQAHHALSLIYLFIYCLDENEREKNEEINMKIIQIKIWTKN